LLAPVADAPSLALPILRMLKALREFSVECSMVKVFGSETLDYVVDETVQIHGGYGFSTEYPAERYYRDSRVHRIFEGTNEINRLMISGVLIRQMSKPAERTQNSEGRLENGGHLPVVKTAFAELARAAIQKYGESFCKSGEEQELQILLADIAIDIYAMETALVRSHRLMSSGVSEVCRNITITFQNDAHFRITHAAGQILARLGLDGNVAGGILQPLLDWQAVDTVAARRRVAAHLLQSAQYSI